MDRQDEALSLLQGKLDVFEHAAPLRDEIGQLLVSQGKYADAIEQLHQASMLAGEDPTDPRTSGDGAVLQQAVSRIIRSADRACR